MQPCRSPARLFYAPPLLVFSAIKAKNSNSPLYETGSKREALSLTGLKPGCYPHCRSFNQQEWSLASFHANLTK